MFACEHFDLVPDVITTAKSLAGALRRGLILLTAGTYGNVVRVLAPLTIEDAILDEGLDVMAEALGEAVTGTRQSP
jgi:4-aminobutyrate aminotransferase-like enzyme